MEIKNDLVCPKLAFVVPCYNEEAMIRVSIKILTEVFYDLLNQNLIAGSSMLVFVDDGSTDDSFTELKNNANRHCRILKLTSNRGHQYALLAGLNYVMNKVDCVISIDADLQDDLKVIPQMIRSYRSGAHIVCGVRENRDSDSFFKRRTANLFYWITKKMGVNLIENHADFRLLSNMALNELSKYKESNLFLRGIFPLINLRLEIIKYTQKERFQGKTKYTYGKMLTLAADGITSFSVVPIRLITITGFFLFFLTMLLSINVLFAVLNGKNLPGWASISLPLYFLGGIQLLSLGVIGEYVAKIYFETKKRPLYHIEEIIDNSVPVVSMACENIS